MFLRPQLYAVPRLSQFVGQRIQSTLARNARSLSAASINSLMPSRRSTPAVCSSYRSVCSSSAAASGSSPVPSKDALRKPKTKRMRKQSSPLITAAGVMGVAFDKKVVARNTVPAQEVSKEAKDGKSPETSVIRRRQFLLDSPAYRRSSLECLKELRLQYDERDEARLRRWAGEAPGETLSALGPAELVTLLRSLSRAPWQKVASLDGATLRGLAELACRNLGAFAEEDFVSAVLLGLFKVHRHSALAPEHRRALEGECAKRLPAWDVTTLLLVSDWCICLERKSAFNRLTLAALGHKLAGMSPQAVVQTFYVVGECQHVPSDGFLQQLTDRAERELGGLTWNEAGAVCNAFIKSRSRILSRPLTRGLAARICRDLPAGRLDHFNLVTALRLLSRAYYHDERLFDAMAAALVPHVARMPPLVPPHVAAAFAKVRHFDRPLMDAVASRALQASGTDLRLKDLWMLLWAFARLDYHPQGTEDFFDELTRRLAAKAGAAEHPLQLMKSLVSLTFVGRYPLDLIDRVFDPTTLREYEEKCPKDLYKHLYTLDCSVAIEQPDYRGNRLPEEFVLKFWESPHGSKKVSYDKVGGLQEALDGLQCVLGGAEYIRTHAILPHIRTPVDIEVHLDESSKPIPLNSVPASSLEDLLSRCTDSSAQGGVTRLAVLVAPMIHYRFHSHDLLGAHIMKRRQLQKVGYRIVEVPFYEWMPLLNAPEVKRHDYLKAKIFGS